jgi:serine/threonine protein kinase/tetratricopeptide (TPR) repeat protein
MSPERWKQIEEVFQSALDLPQAERRAFIAGACAGDDTLREQVEALVAQSEQAGDFIEAPAVAVAGFTVGPPTTTKQDAVEDPMVGRRVGSYRVVREVGRGGMGAVYLAERADSAFHKRVALKVVKRGMDTDFILRRFRHERQILASFDHPNIARLLDGGTTEEGLPYFVMEYVEGQPVYRYCDAQRLGVSERLRLFCQVCAAVTYAHQHLVVHRDLKPSNVLVTKDGSPKLLDFGIAKLLNPEMMPDTVTPTASAMRLMTPEYASPEQVQGLAVTPASDIYALGVMLYELLTGHRPYRFSNRSPHEVARVICEDEPEQPSRVVSQLEGVMPVETPTGGESATVESACRARGSSPEALRRELAGNLDNIIMKALRKEPSRRYSTVEEMREDIARHLEGRPISAPLYFAPTIRFPRRDAEPEPGEKSIAILPFKLLETRGAEDTGDEYLGVGLTDALVTRLSSLRRFTLRPTSSVLRYGDKDSDPIVAGRELGVGFVLDGRVRRFGNSIRVNAQLLDVREGTTVWAGQFDEKFTDVLHLEDTISAQVAEALVPQLTGDERRLLAKRGTDNAEAFEAYLRGRYHWSTFTEEGFARALTCYHQAISLDPDYALAYAGIADYYNFLGVYGVLPFADCSAAAKDAATKAVALDDELAEGYTALGFAVICHDFDWKGGEGYHLRAIELNPNYATAHQWYSFHLQMEGRHDEALREARRALELDPFSLSIQQTLGWCYYMARRPDDSLAAYRKLLATEPRFAYGRSTYSVSLRLAGRHDEAIKEATLGVEYGSDDSQLALAILGEAYAAAGRVEEAKEVLSRLGELAARRYVSPYHLALIHCHLGDKELALALLNEAYALRDAWLVWLGVEPQLDTLRSDPRFVELLRLTNNPLASKTHTSPTQIAEADAEPPPSAPRPTENTEAYALYVAARYHERKRTADGLREAISRYEHAIELDPRFALAYAGLSECYALLNWYVEPPPPDAWSRAKRCALKAVELNEELAEAHEALGFVLLYDERDHESAEGCFRRAITLDPSNPAARRWHALNLSAMGRHAEALAEIRRAQEFRPMSAVIATAAASILFFARRFEEATEQCHKALELDPGSVAAHVVLRWSYEQRGLFDEAFAIYEKERAFAGDTPTMRAKLAHTLAAAGRADGARPVLEELLAGSDREGVSPYEAAVVYALLGDREEAFTWLSRAARERAVGFTFVRVDPRLDRLRDDPRFAELLRHAKELSATRAAHAASPDQHTTEGDTSAGQTQASLLVHQTSPTEETDVGGAAATNEVVKDLTATAVAPDATTTPQNAATDPTPSDARTIDARTLDAGTLDARTLNARKAGLSRRAFAVAAAALVLIASVAVFFYVKNSNRSTDEGGASVRTAGDAARGGTQPATTRGVRSVAVLPFTTVGASGDEQYLGVGLADAVSSKLGELNEVTTRPAVAVRRYLGAGKSPFEAGRELGADYVLAGTVERDGARVVTSLELTDVSANRVIWSERLDQRFTDIPTLQSSVSERVATALDIQLTSDERARIEKQTTQNSEAYALYLAGRYHMGKRTPEGLRQAIKSFEQSLAADPTCAFALSGLADSYALLNWYVEPPPADAFERAKEAALKSVALDDTLAEAHVSLAFVSFYYDRDLVAAEREFRRALQLNPTYATAHHRFALVLSAAGRHDEALEEVRRAEQLDPRSAIISAAVANVLFYARRYDEAVEQCRKALELDPGSVAAYTVMRWAYERRGMAREALEAFEREGAFAGDTPTTRLKRAQVLAAAGRADESRTILKELIARRERDWVSAHEIAVAYALLGDRDPAFSWLSLAAREHAVGFAFAAVDPLLDTLRADPRFDDALRAGGINR